MAVPLGYQCEFIDPVFDGFYCKKCSFVAKRQTVVTCCGESFCQACLADSQEGSPCPACGEKNYSSFQNTRNQMRIDSLRVYCSMKEKGCEWSGSLDQLDTHLNSELNNCEFVDVNCPLNCLQAIPKSMVEKHVTQECPKRPYVCQYCNFKAATYIEIKDKHIPDCKYVPLQCPNRCGVTFERDFMEDHMKMCRLEEVKCEFSQIGCDCIYRREDEGQHARQNIQKHVFLAASLCEQLQKRIIEQDLRHHEEEDRLRKKIDEQDKKINEQEEKIFQQNEELKKKIGILEDSHEAKSELNQLKQKLLHLTIQSEQNEIKVSKLSAMIHHKFEMRNFHKEKAKDKHNDWKSPAMYTHACGYKFCIGIDANGCYMGHGQCISVELYSMPGDYDNVLKWLAKVDFTVELINQRGGANASHSLVSINWQRPAEQTTWVAVFNRYSGRYFGGFLEHSKLSQFLVNDTLTFYVSEIHVTV